MNLFVSVTVFDLIQKVFVNALLNSYKPSL